MLGTVTQTVVSGESTSILGQLDGSAALLALSAPPVNLLSEAVLSLEFVALVLIVLYLGKILLQEGIDGLVEAPSTDQQTNSLLHSGRSSRNYLCRSQLAGITARLHTHYFLGKQYISGSRASKRSLLNQHVYKRSHSL